MAVMGRSLLVGMLAWILGIGAERVFPSRHYHLEGLGDWVTMVILSPAEIGLSLILFVAASVLLISLLYFHVGQYVYVRQLDPGLAWMHVFLCLFAFFLYVIQLVKMPVPTAVFTSVAVVYEATSKRLFFLGKRKN